MDDDKQVKDLTTQTTIGRFLNKPILPDERDKETFDLEKEFAKSAKNRSLLIPMAVLVFLVVLAVGAWVASQFTEEASQKSSVSIGSFEDLKLKEIFDTARKNKKDLETIQAQIDELVKASELKVAAIRREGSSKADIASVNDSTGEQAKVIEAATAKQVAAEKAALSAALAPLKAQADEVQKKIDSYDDRIGQMNKKNQQVLDTQQRLFDLEKKKLTDQYESRLQSQADEAATTLVRVKEERDTLVATLRAKQADDIRKLILKYNPVINDGLLKAQLAKDGGSPAEYLPLLAPSRIADYDLIPATLQQDFAARVERTRMLLDRLRQIPYENSVPPLLNVLDKAIADSLVGFNGYLVPLADHINSLDALLRDREGTIAEREATIAHRDATIAYLTATLAERDATIVRLNEEMVAELADRKAAEEAAMAERLAAEAAALADRRAAEAAEAADREAERARAAAVLARWTGAVDDFVATYRDQDGAFTDVRVAGDWMVVLKPARAQALAQAIANAAAAPPPAPPAPGKTAPVVPPVNLATVRDGLNNAELGTVTVEQAVDGSWRAKLVKQNDPKKPFKAFDRIVLALPLPKK